MAMNDTFPRFGIQRKNIDKWSWLVTLWTLWSHQTSQIQTFTTSTLLFKKSLKRFLNNEDNVSSLSLFRVCVCVCISLSLSSLSVLFSLYIHTREPKRREKEETRQRHTTQHHTTPTIQERTENQTKVKFDDSDLTRFLIFFFFFDNFYTIHCHIICMTLFSVSHLDFHFPFLLFCIYVILPHPSHLMNYNFVFQYQVVLCFGFHSCWLRVSELYLNFCFWVRFRIPFMATPIIKI